MLVLHGYAISGVLQLAYFGFDQLVDEEGVLVIAPNGSPDPDGNPFWNPARKGTPGPLVDDVAYLAKLLADIEAEYNVDPARVFVVGHSNGAFMAYRLACDRPELVSAFVSLAGADERDASDCVVTAPRSVLELHADTDATVAFAGQPVADPERLVPIAYAGARDSVAHWAARNGCAGPLAEAPDRHDLDGVVAGEETHVARYGGCPAGIDVELWTMVGGSHIPGLGTSFRVDLWAWLQAHPAP